MARPVYDNSYNRNKTRVDGRQDNWATRAGVTGQHKDSAGNVIGGVGADGTRFGTKSTLSVPAGSVPVNDISNLGGSVRTMEFRNSPIPGMDMRDYQERYGNAAPAAQPTAAPAPAAPMPQPSATPRLDAGVQTPRLDSNPRQNNDDAVARSNRSGAFGSGAQNLQKRKDLFAQMGAPGADPNAFRAQATALGVTTTGWAAGLQRLKGETPTVPQLSGPPAPQAGMKPAAPKGIGAMAPQPNAKPGTPVPRPAMATAPASPKSPAPTSMPTFQSWQAKAGAAPAPAAQAIAGKPPATAAPAPAPVKPPVIPPAPTAARPINNPAQVTFQNPWSGVGKAFADSYAAERENLKKPGRFSGTPIASMLRGATGAAGKFARTNWANLTQTY